MCPKGETVNASEIQLILLASMKNLEEHIAGGTNIFFKHIKTKGSLLVSWKSQEIIFVLWPDLPRVSLLHLKLSLHLSLLQRTLGKLTHTGVFVCGIELEKHARTEAIFAKKQQNLHLGVLTVCYHSPRSSKGIQIFKRHALLKSILVLNTLGGLKRLQINPYQADSKNLQ